MCRNGCPYACQVSRLGVSMSWCVPYLVRSIRLSLSKSTTVSKSKACDTQPSQARTVRQDNDAASIGLRGERVARVCVSCINIICCISMQGRRASNTAAGGWPGVGAVVGCWSSTHLLSWAGLLCTSTLHSVLYYLPPGLGALLARSSSTRH